MLPDVVTFDHITGETGLAETVTSEISDRLGGASRTLDIAIREYAPGAEVVINGLVHKSDPCFVDCELATAEIL